jgi:hypothetical protein
MAIRLLEPPEEVIAALRSGLSAFILSKRIEGQNKRWVLLDTSFSLAHRVWTVADEIGRSTDFRSISSVSWRFLVKRRDGSPLAAEVVKISGKYHWASLNDGPFAAPLAQLFEKLQQDDSLAASDFEFSLLRVPVLHVVAIWLRASDPAKDRFIPVEPTPAWLSAGERYSGGQFGQLLNRSIRELARLADRV